MKDPAFLFYSQDFYVGVQFLTWEERGKYISILCMMHQSGRLKEETIRFLIGDISEALKNKFQIDKNGLWYNSRLETEVEKRKIFVETRRNNGKKGGRPPKTTRLSLGKPKTNLMGNENVNVNVNINNKEIIEEIWQTYPSKTGKNKAIESIKKSLKITSGDEILSKVKLFKEHTDMWAENNKRYIPNGSTYFYQELWSDDLSSYDKYLKPQNKNNDSWMEQDSFSMGQIRKKPVPDYSKINKG